MTSAEQKSAKWRVLKYLEENGFEYSDESYPHHILDLGDIHIIYYLFDEWGQVMDYTQDDEDNIVSDDMSIEEIMEAVNKYKHSISD